MAIFVGIIAFSLITGGTAPATTGQAAAPVAAPVAAAESDVVRSARDWLVLGDQGRWKDGWAATASWRHRLVPHADLILEAQHVASKRPARALAGEAARQTQTVLQSALRLSF